MEKRDLERREREREKKQKKIELQDRTSIINWSRPREGRAVFRQVLTLTSPPNTRY